MLLSGEQQTLKKFIAENGLTVTHLLNTHLHLDHIFGNAFMLREFGVSAEAGKEDEFLLPRTAEYCRMFGFPLNEEPPALGGYVHDGDLIKIGNIELKALAVPGHSPGSMVFYCEAQHCMFSGDVLFQGSIGRADLTGGNFDELREHICSRLFVLPPRHGSLSRSWRPDHCGSRKSEQPFFPIR